MSTKICRLQKKGSNTMKHENTTENKTNETVSNPFVFDTTSNESKASRKIEFTTQLIAISNSKANEIIRTASQDSELANLANKILDNGEVSDTFNLINQIIPEEIQTEDALFLTDANPDVLDRLLESRRSDRSKAKAKGLRTSMSVCLTYFGSAYAELLVRKAANKPYEASSSNLDENDRDAISRKIKSLQSKQSRLSPLAKYDTDKAKELDDVKAEIARLNDLRGTSVKVSSAIKSEDLTVIREALTQVDKSALTEDQQAKLEDLMTKLG